MTATQTEIQSQAIDLSAQAFEAFCEDISGMFGVDMECSQQELRVETVKELKKQFKKLVAVNTVESEGALDGTFQLVFDQGGLFTLSGVIVMQPENRILEEIKRGTIKDTESINDALKECGNLLIGSWDRIFREGLEGHGHFAQTDTFIGTPWDEPKEKIGLANDEEFLFVPYKMTVGSYPTFNCGVIFPKTIFEETSVSDAEAVAPEDETNQEEPQEQAKDQQDTDEQADSKEPEATDKNDSEESKSQAPVDEQAVESPDKTAEQSVENEQKASDENQAESEEPVVEEVAKVEAEPDEQTEPTDGIEPVAGPVSETIQRMAQSSAGSPDGADRISLAMCAKDIMQKDVLWGKADDSVQQALTKMQQADIGYMMVGSEGSLEGIVSTSDIAATLSVYLKPMFAKWRRPIDDATLQIKIKWIMTRPVRTIKPDTSLTAIMENMCKFGLSCFPVADQKGKVVGLVTAFDIFKAMQNTDSDISTAGKTPQAPSLT